MKSMISLYLLPLVIVPEWYARLSETSGSYKSCVILETSIISPRSLLYLRVGIELYVQVQLQNVAPHRNDIITSFVPVWSQLIQMAFGRCPGRSYGHFRPKTLRTLDTSALVWWVRTVRTDRHHGAEFGPIVPNCLAPSAELSPPKCRSVLALFDDYGM